MKGLFAIMIITFVAFTPLHLDNEYLRATHFDKVTIIQEQDIFALAGRYTQNPKYKEKLVEAICEINDLDFGSSIPAGRSLTIPLLSVPARMQICKNS